MSILKRLEKLYQHTCNNCTNYHSQGEINCKHPKGRRLYYWHPENENNCTYFKGK